MNNHAAVGNQMEGTTVVDFTDDVDLVIASIVRNVYRCDGLVWCVDSSFCRAYLGLLPPQESKRITIWIC